MSYSTIYACANDRAFLERVTACAADEGVNPPAPAAQTVVWNLAAADDIEAAYASALAAGNPNPGGDPAVITDAQILSAFQANWPPAAPPVVP